MFDDKTRLTVPSDCVDKDGEGRDYWLLIADPQSFRCSERVKLIQHTMKCEACAKKSLALGRPLLEQELASQGAALQQKSN